MKVTIKESSVIVEREDGDKGYYGDSMAKGESNLLYAVKKALNALGYDLIKKRMWKDGHMVSDLQQYLRTRKASGDPGKDIMIYNTFWQIRGANADFNEGKVVFGLVRDCFSI